MKESTLKRFLRLPDFAEHLELHRLDATGSNQRLDNYDLARRKFEEYSAEHLQPEPLVTGADLIAMGYQPGPQFSLILHALEDAQLEGRIRTREESMDLVREMFPRGN
jgi:poly(A) polymerase